MANYKLKKSFGSIPAGHELRHEPSEKKYYVTDDIFFLENEVQNDSELFEKVLPKFSGVVGTSVVPCDASTISIGSECLFYSITDGTWKKETFQVHSSDFALWKAGFVFPTTATERQLADRKKKLDEMFKRSEYV